MLVTLSIFLLAILGLSLIIGIAWYTEDHSRKYAKSLEDLLTKLEGLNLFFMLTIVVLITLAILMVNIHVKL